MHIPPTGVDACGGLGTGGHREVPPECSAEKCCPEKPKPALRMFFSRRVRWRIGAGRNVRAAGGRYQDRERKAALRFRM